MDLSDIKIAICAIIILIGTLTIAAYLSGSVTETLIIGLASTGIAAIAGLAGFDMGRKVE